MAGDLAVTIGRRIAARRRELDLTQGQLAGKVGSDAVNNQRISDWERGVNRPSDRYMQEIAQALGRPVAWFYEDEASGSTPDLMAALPSNGDDGTQLDRIEGKLDEVLTSLRRLEAAGLQAPPGGLGQLAAGSQPTPPRPEQERSREEQDDRRDTG
jgi:transcriptional regulator with XRE-family HTH domain